jgi:tRNA U34 2-thiouridine synthase MnmA/TrmU
MTEPKIRALAMMSGGLDSALAARIVQLQGLEVIGLHFRNIFHCGGRPPEGESFAERSAKSLGIELRIVENTPMLLAAVKNPRYGYGKNLNPCIDCRVYMLKVGRRLLSELGAKFIVTGEVLGQRPMTQRGEAMKRIDRDAGVEGLVLRPLCARSLAETIPEREGWVRRGEMLAIGGRSRRIQYELAQRIGVTVFSAPAGGCLLTDPGFAERLRDLLDRGVDFAADDVELLKHGRHFRFSENVRAVVGRDNADNESISALARSGDALVEVAAGHTPLTLVRGPLSDDVLRTAAALTVRYSKSRELAEVECEVQPVLEGGARGEVRRLTVAPASDELIDKLAVGRVAV